MSEVKKIWHRTCVVCKNVEQVEYLNMSKTQRDEPKKKEAKTVVHTDCPDESLEDAIANYRCRACRSAMTIESQKLQNTIMERLGREQKQERSSSEEEHWTASEVSKHQV
ncbi:hypothetical protein ACHAPO_002480 [Fusarium lateritium]